MSAIEYRAWHKEIKKMFPVTMIDFYTKEISVFGAYPPDEFIIKMRPKMIARDLIDFAEVELMKYTGLNDKNGVKIFEGDIVKYYFYHGEPEIEAIKSMQEFLKDCGYRELEFAYDEQYYEVIGNIYDNPELLEKIC